MGLDGPGAADSETRFVTEMLSPSMVPPRTGFLAFFSLAFFSYVDIYSLVFVQRDGKGNLTNSRYSFGFATIRLPRPVSRALVAQYHSTTIPQYHTPGGAIRLTPGGEYTDLHPCTPLTMPTLVPPGLLTTAWVVPSGLYSIRPSMCPPCWSIFIRHDCTSSTLKTSIVDGTVRAEPAASGPATEFESVVDDPVDDRVAPRVSGFPVVFWNKVESSGCSLLPTPGLRRMSVSRFFRWSRSVPGDPRSSPLPPTSISAHPSVATSTRPPRPCRKNSQAWAMSCSRRRTERSVAGQWVAKAWWPNLASTPLRATTPSCRTLSASIDMI